jgi:head-tail adaptor
MPLGKYSLTDRERMGGLARNLKHRCVIQQLSKTPFLGDAPGYYTSAPPIAETYTDIKTVWCYVVPKQSAVDFVAAIRGGAQDDQFTHELIVRWESVRDIGAAFTAAFDNGFDTVRQMNPMKADYFLFIKSGADYRGRRFRIMETRWDERNHEYLRLRCREVEEIGTGWRP